MFHHLRWGAHPMSREVYILLVSLVTTNLPFATLQQSSYVRYPKNGFLPVQKKERRKLLLGLCVHAARCEDNVAVPSPQSCGELQMFDSQHGAVHCRGCICNIKNLVDEVWRIHWLLCVVLTNEVTKMVLKKLFLCCL